MAVSESSKEVPDSGVKIPEFSTVSVGRGGLEAVVRAYRGPLALACLTSSVLHKHIPYNTPVRQ